MHTLSKALISVSYGISLIKHKREIKDFKMYKPDIVMALISISKSINWQYCYYVM